MRIHNLKELYVAILIFLSFSFNVTAQTNAAPILTATGNQIYCPGESLNITTAFNITDTDDTATEAIYIQISSGYENGQDVLTLTGTHPGVTSSWNATSAKLTITGTGGANVPYTSLIAAVEDVVYINSALNPTSGTRTFSITVGQANYLESTDHYYLYVAQQGIHWDAARDAAEASTYYGLQGYLATILSEDEAQLIGEQALGTGWIGGTDEAVEGVWRWVTGPEAGTVFWNGGVNGSTPNYAFWNNGEPNNLDNEDYAHITAPGVGVLGSWNDLPIAGGDSPYVPQGYIVEYGGMPGDPVLQLSATTTISIFEITNTTADSACGSGPLTLQATTNGDTAYWYDTATGGTPIATGTTFTTPAITTTTTYYASAYDETCNTTRTPVTATIHPLPTVTIEATSVIICGSETATLQANSSTGTINWYTDATGGTPIATGTTFTTPIVTEDTVYYAEAEQNGCPSVARTAVSITIKPLPEARADETILFCENDTALLDGEIDDPVTYLWNTGETTPQITIDEAGIYTVTITNDLGCSDSQTFTADIIFAPKINVIQVNNTDEATIIMEDGTQEYEYSIDGINYQSSPVFRGLKDGIYAAYARSLNDCGLDIKTFKVLLVQKFFTPNNDGINDAFTIAGMATTYPQATVTVFDRYGKIITGLNRYNREWDGTYNGNKLPSTDYWYIIKLTNASPEIKGHVSLVR